MIVNIRKHMKHRATKVILWVTLFSIVGGLSFVSMFKTGFKKKNENAVATVNGFDISFLDFRRHYISLMQFIRQAQEQYGDQADMILSFWGISKEQSPEKLTLDNLVSQNLVLSASDKIGANISNDYIQEKLKDQYFVSQNLSDLVPVQAFNNGSLDAGILSMYLERQGISHDEFDLLANNAIKKNLFLQLLRGSSYVNNNSIKEEYIRSYSKKKYGILSFDIEKYLSKAKEQKFTESDFKAFYDKNKEAYRVAQKRAGKVWTFSGDDFGITVTDIDLQDYYNRNRLEFIKSPSGRDIKRIVIKVSKELSDDAANKKAQEIAKEVKADIKAFDKYAQSDLVKISRDNDNFDPILKNAAFNLSNNNQVSDIVKTKEGFEIIKLINKKDPEYKSLDMVKEDIRKKLKSERFARDFDSNAQRVILQSKDSPEVFASFIANKKAKENDISIGEKKLGNMQSQKLFDLATKGSKGFYFDDNKGYIVEVVSIEQSYINEFEKIKDKVAQDFYKQKAMENLKADLDNAVKSGSGKSDLSVTDWINPKDSNSIKALESKGISFNAVSGLHSLGSKTAYIGASNGYLVELKEVDKFDENDFDSKKDIIARKLSKNQVSNVSQDLINSLQKNAKIEINEPLLKRAISRA